MINRQDFQYMWQGKAIRELTEAEEILLHPIHEEKKQKCYGRALIVFHGFASSPAIYRALLPMLKKYDALICPTLPGHGQNIAAFSSVTYQEWLHCAQSTCEAMIRKYDHVEIIGLSLGGVLAYRVAQTLPIKKLYLLAPAFKLQLNTPLAKLLGFVLRGLGVHTINNRGGNLYTHQHEELTYKKIPVHAVLELFKLIKTTQINGLPCKTELFLGVHDDVVASNEIAQRFAENSLCNIHWLNQSAHAIPLDGDLDMIASIVNDYQAPENNPNKK